jgi:MFS family permease
MIAGFACSSLSWVVIVIHPTILTIVAGIVVFSIGEMTQAPRYYEYISNIAPKGQQGLFQGYAFLPIAIAWAVGGTFGGWLYTTYAREAQTPDTMWMILLGIGIVATLLMWVYDRVVSAAERKTANAA